MSRSVGGSDCATIVQSLGRKQIELVGWEKVGRKQQVDALRVVDLRSVLVNGGGPPEQLSALRAHCASVCELDLSRSLIGDWLELARICDCLPALTTLNVGENRFTMPASDDWPAFASIAARAFAHVESLHLKQMDLSWTDVRYILLSQ